MSAPAHAYSYPFVGTPLPKLWNPAIRRSWFGDIVLVLFLLAQCFDGVFTYVGVTIHGMAIEANPIIATLMSSLGYGAALTGAKVVASMLGICLHLREVHVAVALLACFYATVAILPWLLILFF